MFGVSRSGRSAFAVALGLVLLSGVLVALPVAASGGFGWAVQFGGAGYDVSPDAVAADRYGNAYVAGSFEGTVDFDPGPGELELIAEGNTDAFVAKFGPDGDLVWARAVGGPSQDLASGVALDDQGNVYVVGDFNETADFDPGAETFEMTSQGLTDMFVLKLDQSGDLDWARQVGASGLDRTRGFGIAVDSRGNAYTTGWFNGTADFDPGGGMFPLTAGEVFTDAFVSKLDADGGFVWARQLGGTGSNRGSAVAVDGSGSVYTTGEFANTVDFDPAAGVHELEAAAGNVFVWKLNVGGTFGWAAQLEGSTGDGNVLAVAGTGEVSVASTEGGDARITRFDADGDLVWEKVFGGTGSESVAGVRVDGSGNAYVTGRFEQTVDFDPHPSQTFNLVAAGRDVFVSKLDASGGFVWAVKAGAAGGDGPSGGAIDRSGGIYIVGGFELTVDFDPGAGTSSLTSAGGDDAFAWRIDDPDVTRIAGANRFATAAAVAQEDFPGEAPTVFVAVGNNFPDALAGAAVAGKIGAPLLLVNKTSIPAETVSELVRLAPDTIVILGGEGVISVDVESALGGYAESVERLAGNNRYATAVAISQHGFPTTASEVWIATGGGFADALAAGPAAVIRNAPVLLTQPTVLPQVVADEITRLAPTRVVVVGGEAAVSAEVFTQLQALVPNTVRISGSNRYATSVAIAQDAFASGIFRVYVATGLNFPDALAGAAAAGWWGGPILLVPGSSLPGDVASQITALGATRALIVGGTSVVRLPVEGALFDLLGATPVNPGDTKNCTDFTTQAAAQEWFDLYYPYFGDLAGLDGDNDQEACESLP